MADQYLNNFSTTLVLGITAAETQIELVDTSRLEALATPLSAANPMYFTMQDSGGNVEIVKCTGVNPGVIYVERGQDGTGGFAWNAGQVIENRAIALQYDKFENKLPTTNGYATDLRVSTLFTTTISEETTDVGVFVDGVALKDGAVNGVSLTAAGGGDLFLTDAGTYVASGGLFDYHPVSTTSIVGGNEAGLALTASASSNFYGGSSAGGANTNFDFNIGIGDSACRYFRSSNNTFVGSEAGRGLSSSVNNSGNNTGFGRRALDEHRDGAANNTAIGYQAGVFVGTGSNNTFLGAETGRQATNILTGNGNTVVGYRAGTLLQGTGNSNTFVGTDSGAEITTGVGNVMLGFGAGPVPGTGNVSNRLYINNSESDTPLIGGDFGSLTVDINGTLKLGTLGNGLDTNGKNVTTTLTNGNVSIIPNGTGNVFLGNLGIDGDQTVGAGQDGYVLTYTHANGLAALEPAAGGGTFTLDANENLYAGTGAFATVGASPTNAADNFVAGQNAGNALTDNAATIQNVIIGENALTDATTAANNVVIGCDAVRLADSAVQRSVILGDGAFEHQATGNKVNNTIIGQNANAGSATVSIGTVSDAVVMGRAAAQFATALNSSTVIGALAASATSANTVTLTSDTFIGFGAGRYARGGISGNTAVGFNALGGNSATNGFTSISNTAVGNSSLAKAESAQSNVSVGSDAGFSHTTGDFNVYVGAGAGAYNATGSGNVCIGYYASPTFTTGSVSNKLYIENTFGGSDTPLIGGDFSARETIFDGTTGQTSEVDTASITRDYVLTATTAGNGTQVEMFLDGASATKRMVLSDDSTWRFEINIVARRTDANDESAAYKVTGAIDRNTGAATTALVTAVTKTVEAEDIANYDVTVDADTTNGSLRIQVVTSGTRTTKWVAFAHTIQVTG